jgi:hypothetical protein
LIHQLIHLQLFSPSYSQARRKPDLVHVEAIVQTLHDIASEAINSHDIIFGFEYIHDHNHIAGSCQYAVEKEAIHLPEECFMPKKTLSPVSSSRTSYSCWPSCLMMYLTRRASLTRSMKYLWETTRVNDLCCGVAVITVLIFRLDDGQVNSKLPGSSLRGTSSADEHKLASCCGRCSSVWEKESHAVEADLRTK